jgi:AraC-like DNA-binding protein
MAPNVPSQRLTVTPKMLWKLPDYAHYTKSGIYKKYAQIRAWAGKEPGQPLVFGDLARYFGMEEERLRRFFAN